MPCSSCTSTAVRRAARSTCFKALFGRDIRPSELIMATGEALAHLNWLMAKNLVSVEPDSSGVNWYRSN